MDHITVDYEYIIKQLGDVHIFTNYDLFQKLRRIIFGDNDIGSDEIDYITKVMGVLMSLNVGVIVTDFDENMLNSFKATIELEIGLLDKDRW